MTNLPPSPSGAGLQILAWTPVEKNTLRGFVTVRLRNGITLHDCAVHASHGKSWVGLPSKPMLDRNGAAIRDAVSQKIKYVPVLTWADKATADRFGVAVLAALDVLAGQGGPS